MIPLIIKNIIVAAVFYPLVILSYLIGFFPWGTQMKIVGFIATFSPIPKHTKKVIVANLKLCFPEKTAPEIQADLKENIKNTLLILPSMMLPLHGINKIRNYPHTIKGTEHIQAILDEGKGCILLGAHLTHVAFPVILLKQQFNIFGVYRPDEHAVVESVFSKIRNNLLNSVDKNDARAIIKCLRQGRILWYPIDQRHTQRMTGKVKFFGYESDVLVNLDRLIALGNAKVVYLHVQHTNNHYDIEIKAFDEHFYQASATDMMQAYMDCVEETVRAEPAQYLWLHEKFSNIINYDEC